MSIAKLRSLEAGWLTDLVDPPFWSVDCIYVSLLFDCDRGPTGVVQVRATVDDFTRSVEPIGCIDLDCRLICGDVESGGRKSDMERLNQRVL